MRGILYGVGVGPGDPELMTYQAVRTIKESELIAVPAAGEGERIALKIARAHVGDKPVLELDLPMTRDREILDAKHNQAAHTIARYLEEGKNVSFLTLGDPSIYSTYIYIHRKISALGFEARFIAGVPSFCAAAARLNRPLCEGAQPLHIIPASYEGALNGLEWPGTKVLMKAGKSLHAVKAQLKRTGRIGQAAMVECCGMENEKIYPALDDEGETAGYFSLLIVGEGEDGP